MKRVLSAWRGSRRIIVGTLLALTCSASWAESMTLNLKDADINSVIATVSEMTGRNFIVDPRVKGKVTVVSSQPMEAEDIYQVFLTVLNVHGFAAVPGKNVIKIVPEVNAKQDAIPTVGRDGTTEAGQFVTRVIPVNNVTAAQLVPILRPLLPQEGHLAAYAPTNVLIASATAANIERIVGLVKRIDLSSETEVELIPMQHASASEVERILNSLQQSAGAKGATPDDVKVIADSRSNSIILSGDKTRRHHLKKVIKQLDTPLENQGNTRVFYLRYAKAGDLADVLNGVGKSLARSQAGAAAAKGKGAAPRGGTLDIQADEATNALVISAEPEVLRDLEAVIRKLDIRRAQVMVQAVIAEVGEDTSRELGVMWGVNGSATNSPVGVIDFNNSLSNIAAISQLRGGDQAAALASTNTNGLTIAGGSYSSGGNSFAGLVKALSGDSNNNILSTPSLMTLDNEEAEIVVGQTVPFLTGSYTSTGGGSTPTNPFQTIQREDVGLSLKIKPQINEGDAIRMEINHEVSSLEGSAEDPIIRTTKKRTVKTTVMVDDGNVVVLGGLIQDEVIQTEQKVPGLGDIPVLGWLFRYQKNEKKKKDLMVFIHPRIMRDNLQSTALASEKYNYMRALQLNIREEGLRLMSREASPLLPEQQEFLQLPPPFEPQAEPAVESGDVLQP